MAGNGLHGLRGSKRAPFESAYSFHPEISSLKVYVLAVFKNATSGRLPDAGDTEDLNPVDGVNLRTDQERALVLYLDPVARFCIRNGSSRL